MRSSIVIRGQQARTVRMALDHVGDPMARHFDGWWQGTAFAVTDDQLNTIVDALRGLANDAATGTRAEVRLYAEVVDVHDDLVAADLARDELVGTEAAGAWS